MGLRIALHGVGLACGLHRWPEPGRQRFRGGFRQVAALGDFGDISADISQVIGAGGKAATSITQASKPKMMVAPAYAGGSGIGVSPVVVIGGIAVLGLVLVMAART